METQKKRKVSRRRFLEMTALAATGVAAAACAQPAAPAAAPTAAPAATSAPAATKAPTAAPTSTPPPARKGGTMVFGYAQKVSYSDLLACEHNAGVTNYYLRGLTHQPLISVSPAPEYQFGPNLAESWEFDGNKAIFHLRKGVKWHDGEPFTSKDCMFTFGRLVGHPNVGTWNGIKSIADYIVGIKDFSEGTADEVTGVSAPDDYTFIIEMPKPYRNALLEQLNGFVIMPEHLLSKYPEDQWKVDAQGQQGLKSTDYAKKQGIGTGPFRVSNYVPDQIVEYEPFDDYWGGKPQLDKLAFVPYTDRLAMAAAVETGECHIAIRAPESEIERFKTLTNARIVLNPGPSATVFYHNVRPEAPLGNKLVRQALTVALDKDKIAEDFWYGTVTGAKAQFWWGDYGINPAIAEYYDYNPERAKQLLKDGGWDPNYKLRLMMQSMSPANEPLYAMVREMWDAVGVQTEFQITGAEYTNVMLTTFDLDTLLSGYGWGITPAGATGIFRYPTFGDDDATALGMIDEIALMEDEVQIKDAMYKLQAYAADNPRHTLLAQVPGLHLVSNKVKGADPRPIYGPRTDWIDWVNVYMEA